MWIRCARAARDGSIYIYGLAEEPDGTGWSLVFSQDEGSDEGYALSTPDGATCYDALRRWRVEDDVLELELTEEAARTLGLPLHLLLTLDTTHVRPGEVRAAMSHFANPY